MQELEQYNPADVAMSLCRMISYNIGQLAYLNAKRWVGRVWLETCPHGLFTSNCCWVWLSPFSCPQGKLAHCQSKIARKRVWHHCLLAGTT